MTRFCRRHAAVLSLESFKWLSSEEYLPVSQITPKYAVLLLDAERKIVGNNVAEQQGGGGDVLSSLQVRCVNAIACGTEASLASIKTEKARNLLKQQPHLVLWEIISRGLLAD